MNTHAQNVALMAHALGKTPDSRHDLYQTYNTAGRALFTRHPWSWRKSQPATFTFTAGQSELALPSDCDAVQFVMPQNGIQTRIRVVTLAELYMYKSQSQIVTPDYLVAVEDWQAGTPPVRRIQIYPTPAANLLTYMSYTRTWVDASSPGAGTPNIPPDWERALILMARAFAMHIENQATSVEDAAANAEVDRLISLDSEKTPNFGRVQSGWACQNLPLDRRVPVASITLAAP